jgi:hypothetical protein
VVLLAVVARVAKVVGLPEPTPTAASADDTSSRPATSVFATGLAQTPVDRGEVVERLLDGEQGDRRCLVVTREERIVSATDVVKDGEKDDKAELRVASVGDGEPLADRLAYEDVPKSKLRGKMPAVAERKTKRRKKANAIDELFAGLS